MMFEMESFFYKTMGNFIKMLLFACGYQVIFSVTLCSTDWVTGK